MKEAYIRFMAPVTPETADGLLKIVDKKLEEKCERIHLMISSPGGLVFYGLSLFNFLRGAPVEVFTYNFGSVDSIGVVIFCAGRTRFSVPHARFLLHGVRFNISGKASFDDKQIDEHLKSLRIDQQNIARVIADTVQKPFDKVADDMNNRITLNATEAKDYGLIHEIKSQLFPIDADLSVIREVSGPTPQVPVQITQLPIQAFTRSADLDYGTL